MNKRSQQSHKRGRSKRSQRSHKISEAQIGETSEVWTPQVLDTIERVSKAFSQRYAFAYYAAEDIEQECFIFAMEALPKYDGRAPLEHFLSVHLRNRLLNLRRDKYCRQEHIGKPLNPKTLVMQPICLDDVDVNKEGNLYAVYDLAEHMNTAQMRELVEQKLEVEFRMDYLRLIQGAKIPPSRKERLKARIMEILAEGGQNHGSNE